MCRKKSTKELWIGERIHQYVALDDVPGGELWCTICTPFSYSDFSWTLLFCDMVRLSTLVGHYPNRSPFRGERGSDRYYGRDRVEGQRREAKRGEDSESGLFVFFLHPCLIWFHPGTKRWRLCVVVWLHLFILLTEC